MSKQEVEQAEEFFSQDEVTEIIVNTITGSVSGVIEWLKDNQRIINSTTGEEIKGFETKLPNDPRAIDVIVREYIVPILKESGIDLDVPKS